MKYLKVLLVAIIAVCSFGAAQAQVNVRIGGRPHPYHRRVVVVQHRHWHHRAYHRHY
ncbi:MAG: hypothetical protein JWQ79_3478 [Mucilaginibacter sp.]|jgi:hypothetical protein|nr:hypothetical protein [Mucilaginibacter sp.]